MNTRRFSTRIYGLLKSLTQTLWRRLMEKGIRFLCVAVGANAFGLSCSYVLYKRLTPALSIALVSIISGILHTLITYSSHYFLTFGRPGNYFKGLWKVYLSAWLGMLIASFLGQFLMGTLRLPFFVAQALIFGVGAAYSIVVNFLFIFRNPSPPNLVGEISTPAPSNGPR